MDADQIPADLVEAADLALATTCVEVEVTRGVTKCVCPTDQQIRTVLASVWDQIVAAGDGYHTMDELYRYRMLYNAHAAAAWLARGWQVVKSWKHADGEECFGGGWFIVTATLPTGQVSNHYQAEHWDLFAVPQVDLPPAWDGHTPADAAVRLEAAARRITTTGEEGDRPPASALGDRLRTEADDYARAHAGECEFTATLRELAAQADHAHSAHKADVENLRRSNAALVEQVNRVRQVATLWKERANQARCEASKADTIGTQHDAGQRAKTLDIAADTLIAALDGSNSKDSPDSSNGRSSDTAT